MAMANALVKADAEAASLETALKEASERARVLREETLPGALMELGVTEVKLETGEKVSMKMEVYASIPVARRDDAFTWLDQHGFGGLIKAKVSAPFGRGEEAQAQAALTLLQNAGVAAELSRDIHPQTLKAFLREQMAAGNKELDLELFGARPTWVAKIK